MDHDDWGKLKRTEQQILEPPKANLTDTLEDGQDAFFLMAGREKEKKRRKKTGNTSSSNKRLKLAPVENLGETVDQESKDGLYHRYSMILLYQGLV